MSRGRSLIAVRSAPSSAASRRSSGTWSVPRNENRMITAKAAKTSTMTGPRLVRKASKSRPEADPMRMFGGSPMSVAVPPMFEARMLEIR